MAELTLTRDQRLRLKSQAHHLGPIVLLGANGLTASVVKEIDRALTAHQLVKVRAPASEPQERERLFFEIAERLAAARIQLIGRLMVLFRPLPEGPHPRASRAPSPASGRGKPLASARPRGGAGSDTSPRPPSGRGTGGEGRQPSGRESDNSPRPRSGRGAEAGFREAPLRAAGAGAPYQARRGPGVQRGRKRGQT